MRKLLKVLIFIILFLSKNPYLSGQVIDTAWTKMFGGIGYDIAYSIQQTDDDGYIITGATSSYGVGGTDVYLLKTNSLGDTLWTKIFGGGADDRGYSVQKTVDKGFIITGTTNSYGARNDIYLIKTDSLGNTLWTRTFGGENNDQSSSVQQVSDKGYIITGFTSSYGAGDMDVYLIKTDSLGDTLWTKTFGGTCGDLGCSVQQTYEGGYIITGWTISYGPGHTNVYLIKTDSLGDTLWTKTFGQPNHFSVGKSVQQTTDGGYIITGYTDEGNADLYLIKTDSLGDPIWTRNLGGNGNDWGLSVQQTNDGGYVVAGFKDVSVSGIDEDIYIIRTNSLGDTLWTKTYGKEFESDRAFSIQQTTDCGFIVSGRTELNGSDIYLLKMELLPAITVISPNGGEDWLADSTFDIKWTSYEKHDGVRLEYSSNNGRDWIEIITRTPDNGSYPWNIPYIQSDSCLVRISDSKGNMSSDVSNAIFTILPPAPEISNDEPPDIYSLDVRSIITSNQIEFKCALPEKTDKVRFVLYNIAGLKVKEEILKENSAGFYSGKVNTSGISKGIYFIRMEVNGGKFTQTRKFVLM